MSWWKKDKYLRVALTESEVQEVLGREVARRLGITESYLVDTFSMVMGKDGKYDFIIGVKPSAKPLRGESDKESK